MNTTGISKISSTVTSPMDHLRLAYFFGCIFINKYFSCLIASCKTLCKSVKEISEDKFLSFNNGFSNRDSTLLDIKYPRLLKTQLTVQISENTMFSLIQNMIIKINKTLPYDLPDVNIALLFS